jgi:hypothetical protein
MNIDLAVPSDTPDGRAKNRRIEIVLGSRRLTLQTASPGIQRWAHSISIVMPGLVRSSSAMRSK